MYFLGDIAESELAIVLFFQVEEVRDADLSHNYIPSLRGDVYHSAS